MHIHAIKVVFVLTCLILLGGCGRQDSPNNAGVAEERQGETEIIAPAPTQAEAARDTADNGQVVTRVVMLGDSLIAGFGLSAEEALPAQLQQMLVERDIAVDIINAGVSGDTTTNGLARYDWSVASNQPDLVVVALGANDFLMGVSPEIVRMNLEAIIIRAKNDNTPMVLVGLAQRGEVIKGSREEAYGAIYPELANAYGLALLPAMLEGVRDQPELLQADGLHPTAEGAQIVARNLADFLGPIIEGLGTGE